MKDGVTDKAKELYDDITFGHLSYDRARHNPLLFRFLGMIKPGERVFDIGCGAGYWMQVYVDYGVPKDCIVGVDISPTNVANLRKQGFHAEWGNVLELQLEDGVSDFTVCNGVIHHTNDPFRAFEELARITRPGGYIWLQVYNQWNPYYYIVHRAAYPLRYL
jgi:ubiquinone/menaquinone biosynthesis C-methylase UbiE